jgi:hypothetical protein
MIRLLAHSLPHSRQQLVSLSQSSYVSPVELTDWGVGEQPNHTTVRKAWPSLNYSILSKAADMNSL